MALTKALANEYAPHNVLVNAMLVGIIESDQWVRRHASEQRNITWEEWKAEQGKSVPLGRMGYAHEFAAQALLLASEMGGYITGTADPATVRTAARRTSIRRDASGPSPGPSHFSSKTPRNSRMSRDRHASAYLLRFPSPDCPRIVRGGDLSTISRSDGTGSNPQSEETDALLQDDCAMISETLQTQLDRLVIRMVHGDEKPAAYIVINPPGDEDLTRDLAIDTGLVALGVKQDPADLAERYGRELVQAPDPAAPVIDRLAPAGNYNVSQARVPKGKPSGGTWTDEPEFGGNGVPYAVDRRLKKKEDAAIDSTVAPPEPPSAEELQGRAALLVLLSASGELVAEANTVIGGG
jgi:hypothetical protein